ncbi:MAG: glycosyltransferase family 2 protein [Arachidicoccus sp.]|nr:glycosyltransferase family 2 protein [Arachidicoccus sp.]
MELSIIIVNYNVKYFLEHCLHAANAAMQSLNGEIIVVDNHSSDESLAYLKPKYPSVIFIENKKNTGFAKANNQGLGIAKGEYVLYLNPDTIIAENTLIDCIHFLDNHKDAAAAGVQLLTGSGIFLPESKRSFPSAMTSFYKLFLIEKIFPKSKTFGKYSLGFLDKNKVHDVDVLAGAFIIARIDLLKKINGFDERYFMYGEDIDLSYELQKTGYKNYYLGNLPIIHFKGESTKKASKEYVKIFYGAMRLFVEKHYKGSSGFFYTNFLKLAIKGRSAVAALAKPFEKVENPSVFFEKIFLTGDNIAAKQAKNICIRNFPGAQCFIQNNADVNFATEKTDAIIFCIGEKFSYQNAIDMLRKNAPAENVFWFYENGESIIGSSSKNCPGKVMV